MSYSGTAAQVLSKLQAYKIKDEGNGQFRSNSPFRTGSNSHAFVLTITGNEQGVFCDHANGDRGGTLYELARHLGIELPKNIEVAETKRAYKGIADYAAAHGVPVEVLTKAGWREVDYQKRPALEFKTDTGNRWRFLDGNKPHYISPRHYKRCWYGLKTQTATRVLQGFPLVICNGEISTVVAHHYGIPAAAITGGEKESIPPELMEVLQDFLADMTDPLIIVAMDCDPAGRKSAMGIASDIKALGYRVKAVDLGFGKGGDLADFCNLHRDGALEALANCPPLPDAPILDVSPRAVTWRIEHSSHLDQLPPVTWIIPGEIPDHALTVLFGMSGAGKSFLGLDYALQIAQEYPVLYIIGEGEHGYRQRIVAWEHHHKKTRANLYVCIGAVSMMDNDELELFISQAFVIKPKMVIVDTLARSMVGADENSTRDMMMFIQACDMIKRSLDCAVLIVHHTGKAGTDERGSSSLRGAADSMLKLSDYDNVLRLESIKSKDSKPFTPRHLKLLPVEVMIDQEMIASAVIVESEIVIQTNTDPLSKNQRKVLDALALDVFLDGANRQDIADTAEIPTGSLNRTISELYRLGFIWRTEKRGMYKISDAGAIAIGRQDLNDRSDRHDRADQKTSNTNVRDHSDQIDQDKEYEPIPLFEQSNTRYYREG